MLKLKKFNCTQRELYAVCAHAWESCNQNLDRFGSFKARYNAGFIEKKLAEIARVEGLRDRCQRSGHQEKSRIELKAEVEHCLQAWRKLKTYILEAFPEEQQDACLKIAGLAHYRDTIQMKWEACQSLMSNGEAFIRENAGVLLTNEVMDAGFTEEFSAQNKSFMKAYQLYLDSARQGELSTAEKQRENNLLYKDMMAMFADARIIFKKEPSLMKLFVFEAVLLLVSGQSTAGIKGNVSHGLLSVASIEGLVLSLKETGDTVFVNEDGTYRFGQMAAGVYTLHVTAPGYKEQLIPGIIVNTGAYTTQNVVLEKEPVGIQ